MSRTAYLIIVLLCSSSVLLAQELDWVRSFGGSSNEIGRSVVLDDSRNVYTTGSFFGVTDFDPGPETYPLNASGLGDVFITKLDSSGHFSWARRIGGPMNDDARSIAIDPGNEAVYITGYFQGTVDFDPGPGFSFLTADGNEDIFVCKLDSSGQFVWARRMGSSVSLSDVSESGNVLKTDGEGNVYIAGYFRGSSDFDPGPAQYELTSEGSTDVFVCKLNSEGEFLWARNMGGEGRDEAWGMALDESAKLYTSGAFSMTADFDPGNGDYFLESSGELDVFVQCLDSSGQFQWAVSMGGPASDEATDIALDPLGRVFTTGYFTDTADFDPGPGESMLTSTGANDCFVSKLNAAGQFIWARGFGGDSDDGGQALLTDPWGYVYTAGTFQGTVDFDPGMGTMALQSAGEEDIFIQKLNETGRFEWAVRMGGAFPDYGFSLARNAAASELLSCGYFQASADFDPGSGTTNLSAKGGFDVFVQKLSQCPNTTATIYPTRCNTYLSPSGEHLWNSSGTYTDVIQNAAGCDSIITIHLTILHTTSASFTIDACDHYVPPSGEYLWTTSGTYFDTIPNAVGCDSVLVIDLQLGYSSSDTLNIDVCDRYISPSGKVWTSSGMYMDTIRNESGCDSVLNIQLTVRKSSSDSLVVSSCEEYVSPGGKVWDSTGLYTDTIINAMGCDSVLYIELSIHHETSDTLYTMACERYISPSGKIWTSTGFYRDTLSSVAGCDSLFLIELILQDLDETVRRQHDSLIANLDGVNYQWIYCDSIPIGGATNRVFVPQESGRYSVIVYTTPDCRDTSECHEVMLTSLATPVHNPLTLRCIPNPTSGDFTLDLGDHYSEVEVRIFNVLGGEIVRKRLQGTAQRWPLHVKGPPGLYLLTVRTGEGRIRSKKLIKTE